MKHMRWWTGCVLCLFLACFGCQHKQSRGLCANKDNAVDSSAINEVLDYQKKAFEAENEVIAFVKVDSTNRWVQHEFGWWYRYTHMSDDHDDYGSFVLKLDTCYLIHEFVYDLSGALIVDAVRVFDAHREDGQTISENEPFAYQFTIPDLSPTDTVMMLVPWYLAYGAIGNTYIQPYANIRVLLALHTNWAHEALWVIDSIDAQAYSTK